ncbi:hypothetical protein F4779DRAFT_597202 [Xylariaceae sp. FL0662B]|nr:hypothetical protein F4779DRAFT_597202 [Xylariaceae sp. FL0662B]
MNVAWECRDAADQAEIYYNHPLRNKNKHLEDENLALKRLLRENNISWQVPAKLNQASSSIVTRSRKSITSQGLPHLPVEIQLKILSYALTSPHPIVDPLCKLRPERLLIRERSKPNFLAIHFLATCKAFYVEGIKYLWTNNSFVFTSPEALKMFADVDLAYRQRIQHVNFRIIAKYYDDEDRIHKIRRSHHPDLKKPIKLQVHRRPRENALARHGFRAYGWFQLVDFLEAMQPPYDPTFYFNPSPVLPPRLLPSLETLRIDFVNFGEDLLQHPPPQLHELASHQFGCTLNEVVLTGLPSDESGFRVSSELSGLLKDEGLLVDHAPTMVALRNGIRPLTCDSAVCNYSSKVVRAMRTVNGHVHDDDHAHFFGADFPPAPKDEGDPPYSFFHSCRTIWKKVPLKIDGCNERKWELFDRISGLPWDDIEDDATMFDFMADDDEGLMCENCGEIHPGAIPPDDMVDLYDDL